MLIPRVVYQTAKTIDLPPDFSAIRSALIEANPDWAFELFDDEAVMRFIVAEYGRDMLDRYHAIRPEFSAARADLFRYLLIYRYGGVYLDIKSTADRPLDAVVRPDDAFLLAQWRNRPGDPHFTWGFHPGVADVPGGELQQWHIAAAPAHPFLAAVIAYVCARVDGYDAWRDGIGFSAVMAVTGPVAYTRAIWPIRQLHPHRLSSSEAELGFVYSAMDGLAHRKVTASHYARQRLPVVGPRSSGPAGMLLALRQQFRDRWWIMRLRMQRMIAWLRHDL